MRATNISVTSLSPSPSSYKLNPNKISAKDSKVIRLLSHNLIQ